MPRQIRPDKELDNELAMLYRLPPRERAVKALERIEFHRTAMRTLASTRAKAIKFALEEGITATALAEELGISRQQLYRLMEHDV
jgi:DNA-binding Xre family transcriptional regulator